MSANNTTDIEAIRAAEHIYREWMKRLAARTSTAALKLYAPDAVLESPLVRHILGGAEGIIRGRDDLRSFVDNGLPAVRLRYGNATRDGFLTDGKRLIWEYPRLAPNGQQIDLVEAMDIAAGSFSGIACIGGWLGVKVLEEDGYRPT